MLTPEQADRLAASHLLDPFDDPPDSSQESDPDAEAGAAPLPVVSGYRIRRLIAAGGMGAVYEAEQERPRRTVAIKLLRPGLFLSRHNASARRRLEYEAEVLGQLRHHGIAQIHEAGTHDDGAGGAPYFVMEYVEQAVPITEWAQSQNLSRRRRLEVFIEACDAVHYAHRKGIIHRDLKPANILVGRDGRAKVIDFGIARATDADVTVATLTTGYGTLAGTVQYMSPEQCEGDAAGLDVRSDVYSLGVVLYELVCGRPPLVLAGCSIVAATRMVRERTPPRPSEIDKRVRGDLETIILKAIEKDREKRYQSSAELGADVQRFLNGEPIEARPPGPLARCLRCACRHPVLLTAMVCGLMIAGTAISSALAVRYLRQRPYAVQLAADGKEARLVSVAGDVLRTWRGERGVVALGPLPSGETAMVLVGYAPGEPVVDHLPLSAYDPRERAGEPRWEMGIVDEDLPAELIARGMRGSEFGVLWLSSADVFPEVKGEETIVVFGHWMYSHAVLRVLDQAGAVLFQMWHDGAMSSVHWMSDVKLLVMIGLNGAAYWEHRGVEDAEYVHPRVVFAVVPELGRVERDWLRPHAEAETAGTADGAFTAAWYKGLRAEAQNFTNRMRFHLLAPADRNRREIGVTVVFDCPMCALTFALDARGDIVPGSLVLGDGFNRWDDAPDPALFEPVDLPPILAEFADVVGPGRKAPARRDRAER